MQYRHSGESRNPAHLEPGCNLVLGFSSVDAVESEIRAAIRFHIEGLEADGLPVPAPSAIAEYVDA
jgi:predicted RNase H-like HicB family nuclease